MLFKVLALFSDGLERQKKAKAMLVEEASFAAEWDRLIVGPNHFRTDLGLIEFRVYSKEDSKINGIFESLPFFYGMLAIEKKEGGLVEFTYRPTLTW